MGAWHLLTKNFFIGHTIRHTRDKSGQHKADVLLNTNCGPELYDAAIEVIKPVHHKQEFIAKVENQTKQQNRPCIICEGSGMNKGFQNNDSIFCAYCDGKGVLNG